MAHAINWFEIPVTDMDRASKFYETILESSLQKVEFGGIKMAMLPGEPGEISGALCQGEWYKPSSSDGPIIYLNGGDDLNVPLSKVEAAGGKIAMPKTKITDEYGYFGLFIDTEGNRMAFHSRG